MKSHGLARFVAPPPPPAPRCMAPQCEMAPEVIVPLGEGALELCWLCAHHHVDHGVPLSECATSERCEHTPDEIYPRGALSEEQGAFGTLAMSAHPHTSRLTVARVVFDDSPPTGTFGRPRSRNPASQVAARASERRGQVTTSRADPPRILDDAERADRERGYRGPTPDNDSLWPDLILAKPAWRRGRGPDRVSRMRRSK